MQFPQYQRDSLVRDPNDSKFVLRLEGSFQKIHWTPNNPQDESKHTLKMNTRGTSSKEWTTAMWGTLGACQHSHHCQRSMPPWPKRQGSLGIRATFLQKVKCNHSMWRDPHTTVCLSSQTQGLLIPVSQSCLFLNKFGICESLFLTMFKIFRLFVTDRE